LDPIEHQFRVLKLAGIKPMDKNLELWPSPADDEKAESILKDSWIKPGQEVIGINVGASSRWLSKNWPPKYIARLCDDLAKEFNIRVVLTGTKDDSALVDSIIENTSSKPITASGRTGILELASLIKRCRIYITPDSAPMHIASAVGTPFIALFGPTDPARHVAASKNYIVLKKDIKCSPCYSPKCSKKINCMNGIPVDDVFNAVKGIISKETVET
jgi:ADP-heptose:LPS heptosyltransferase